MSRSDEVITQLNPPPHGNVEGWRLGTLSEAALPWVVFVDADGACWTVPNSEVRMTLNWNHAPANAGN